MTAEGNNEMLQSYSDYNMEANDFYSQNSVSDIITAHWGYCCRLESIIPNTRIPGSKM